MLEKYRETFALNYNGNNIEEVIEILKSAGASQMDTLKVIRDELNISIRDADELVLNSIAWKENKERSVAFRNAFFDIVKNAPNEN